MQLGNRQTNAINTNLKFAYRPNPKNKITIETIRFPAPGVALADGRYELTDAQGATRRMWSAFVLVRRGAGWRIASIRNMLPAAR